MSHWCILIFIKNILATLHFLGHGNYQFGVGQTHILGMSQPSVSKAINIVTEIIVNNFSEEWIRFPFTIAEINKKKERYLYKFTYIIKIIMIIFVIFFLDLRIYFE